jgi:hypothetical protein
MHKLMNKDKIILRFTARMAPTATHALSHADAGRNFVLSYFLMDDSLLIVGAGVAVICPQIMRVMLAAAWPDDSGQEWG